MCTELNRLDLGVRTLRPGFLLRSETKHGTKTKRDEPHGKFRVEFHAGNQGYLRQVKQPK